MISFYFMQLRVCIICYCMLVNQYAPIYLCKIIMFLNSNMCSLCSKAKHVNVQNINCLTIADIHCVAFVFVYIEVLQQEQRVHRDAISASRGRC